jgi:ribonuclease PH
MRKDGREDHDFRPVVIQPGYIDNVPGSAMIELGKTRVICTATFESRVPHFLRDSDRGWIAADYAMLPGSTGNRRTQRERDRVNNRNIEIQRFLGRALRNTINLKAIKGFTISVDADVIRADGSTRCASLNSGMVSLVKCLRYLVFENVLADMPKIEMIAAVSIGVKGQHILVDLDYEEDFSVDADINIVSSEKGAIIEVEAFVEEKPVEREVFLKVVELGIEKNMEIIQILKKCLDM